MTGPFREVKTFFSNRHLPATFFIAPVFIGLSVFLVLCAKQSQGPYWLGQNSDPDYCYLLNSCAIARFHSPGLYGHPGTPLQVLGAIVVSVRHIFANTGIPLDQDIIERPELYLNSISVVLNLGLLIGILWLAISSYLSTGFPALALFSMTIIFSSSAVLASTVRVNPEPALLLVALLLQIALVSTFKKDRNNDLTFIVFSCVVGLGIATKVTFAPFAVIPIFILKGLKHKLSYCAGTIAFFILFTLPAAVHYRAMAKWFLNLASHTGTYGYGPAGIINPVEYMAGLKSLFSAEPILFMSIVLGLTYLLTIFLHKNRDCGADYLFRILAACLAGQLLSVLLVAKHPNQRYLVPALAFIGFNAGILLMHALMFFKNRKHLISLFFLVYFLLLVSPSFRYPATISTMKTRKADGLYLSSIARNDSSAIKVFYYGASAISFALFFGNSYAGERFSAQLQSTYPANIFYDPWGQSFSDYTHTVLQNKLAIAGNHQLLFQGYSFETKGVVLGLQKPGFILNKIIERSNEALYHTVTGD